MLSKTLLAINLLIAMISTASAVSTTCMDFESYPLNAQYHVGNNQTYNNIFGEFLHFQDPDGVWVEDGVATVVNSNNAFGSGKELSLNNIIIRYIFSAPLPIVATFKYADHGGNVNLGVNGVFNNVNDLSDLNGSLINGVLVLVTRTNTGNNQHHGTVALIGFTDDIERFGVGGQEFWVDDVCVGFP